MSEYIIPTDVHTFIPEADKTFTVMEVKNERSYKTSTKGFYLTCAISEGFKLMKTSYGYVKGYKEKQIIKQEIYRPKDISEAFYNKVSVTADDILTIILPSGNWEFPSLRFFPEI